MGSNAEIQGCFRETMSGSMKWRVQIPDLRKGFKVKSSSAPFKAGGHSFCLDVYLDGWGDDDKDSVACYVRYVGASKKVLARASISLANGPTWTAEEDCLFGRVADTTARTRAGTKRFFARALLDGAADAAGYLTLSASVDLSGARLGKNGHVDLAPRSPTTVERMTEREIADELDKVDREEIQGLSDPKTTLSNSGFATQAYRNCKFSLGIVPIVVRYLRLKSKVTTMRKKLKKLDRVAYYDERTTMWDEEHEQAAGDIRRLFNRMGGLYNKLAQDFATRDGLLPQAWVDEMKHSFEEMPPRPWAVMKKCLIDGLVGEKIPPIRPDLKGLDGYFAAVDEKPLAAASIGQVHVATMHADGERVIVKAIYPEIRKYLVADLINARYAANKITSIMDMPVKGTIDAIMDEQVDSFPRELDLRIEARHLRKSRLFFQRHGLAQRIAIPYVIDELTSSAVLTQTMLDGKTLSGMTYDDPVIRAKAIRAVRDVALGIGVTLFRERFFHSDPHPGNIMLLGPDLKPGLIDFGQCTTLTKEQVRTVCHVVILLRTRSPTLIDKVLAAGDFNFNTEDPELKMALMYYFFDSSQSGGGAVRPEAMEFLKDAMQHNPSIMPVLTDTPREMVFYGRVCGTLRKCFELLGGDESVISLWYPEARAALQKINDGAPDPVSSALLLLPENPDGLSYLVERAPAWTTAAIKWTSSVGDRIAKIAGEPVIGPRSPAKKSAAGDEKRAVFDEENAPPPAAGRVLAALCLVLGALYLFAEAIIRGAAALSCFVAFLLAAAHVVGWRPRFRKVLEYGESLKAAARLLFPDHPFLAEAAPPPPASDEY